MMRLKRYFSAKSNNYSESLLFENKDKTLIRASYFAIICQTIFWASVLDMALDAPEKEGNETILGSKFIHDQQGILLCTGLACLFPLGIAYGASKRIKRISLIKSTGSTKLTTNYNLREGVVKIENFLPFRNTRYYSLNGLHCKAKAPAGK